MVFKKRFMQLLRLFDPIQCRDLIVLTITRLLDIQPHLLAIRPHPHLLATTPVQPQLRTIVLLMDLRMAFDILFKVLSFFSMSYFLIIVFYCA